MKVKVNAEERRESEINQKCTSENERMDKCMRGCVGGWI